MADALPTSNYYKNLGGINLKASQYEMSTAQFLDLRNLDFDVPNALQKRPGSTQAVSAGTSGPIQSLFEFVKLTGESYVVAASDTALFYIAGAAYTLLSSGWNNGQPPDMLTFVNELWVANGQSWISWSGNSGNPLPVGLPAAPPAVNQPQSGFTSSYLFNPSSFSSNGTSGFLVAGASMILHGSGQTAVARGIYMAYAYVRNDGYLGPIDFQTQARNIVMTSPGNGAEITTSTSWGVGGFTIPSGYGISGVALYFAEDTLYGTATAIPIAGVTSGPVAVGALGWFENHAASVFESYTMKPNADLSRFWLYTIIPGASLFLTNNGTATYWAATNITFGGSFANYDGVPPLSYSFSGMPWNFFATYIPKYIEVNQNIMFSAGFSAAPSVVYFSDLGEPESIQPDNFFEVRTNDGDKIYAIKAFNNQLIIAKEHSFSRLVGNSADNFQLVECSTDYGCISQRTMLTKDQTLYWLDKKGILEFNGANWTIVSSPIEAIFRRMNLSVAKEKACGVHHLYRNQLWWGIPVDGSSVNNLTVVYDYLIGAWTFFDGFNAASFAYVRGQLSQPTVWRGDYSGIVHYTGSSFYSDSGQGITCLAFTRFENDGGENQTTLWRRLFLDTAASSGVTGAITGQIFSNYDTSTVQATFSAAQTLFQSRIEMGVLGKAVAAKFSHSSASLPLLVNGYGFAKRGLRNV